MYTIGILIFFLMQPKRSGFTLIELLIVIALIATIASVAFVALDPLTRFRDARDSARWADISAVLSAVKVAQVDNGGAFIDAITDMSATTTYMIGTCSSGATAAGVTNYCDVDPDSADCVDLAGLVSGGYLGAVPISQNGEGSWSESITGYTIEKSSSGIITVAACESENAASISITR